MSKDAKIQIRIESDKKEWLINYVKEKKEENKDISISKIFVDFIDWLKSKEERNG